VAKFVMFDIPKSMRLTGRKGHEAFITPTADSINALEEYIRWAEIEVPSQLPRQMDNLVKLMAILNQGVARGMSWGVSDPQEQNPSAAWKLPVRRISGRYYMGWKVRSVRMGVAELYNNSREAYFIEFGINWLGADRRVRRPVRKLSLHKTMKLMMTTHAYHRIWSSIFADPKRRFHRGIGFTQIVQSPGGGHQVWENISLHEVESEIVRNAKQGKHSPNLRRVVGRGGENIYQRRVGSSGQGRYTGRSRGRRLP
jgi:hypothetical protein